MVCRSFLCAAAVCVALASAAGCAFVPKSELDAAQSQNRVLTEQNRAQLAEIANLKTHAAKVQDQLIEAERNLAALEGQSVTDGRQLAAYQREREAMRQQLGGMAYGWRSSGQERAHLAELARHSGLLKFDEQTGICKLEPDVLFESGRATLSGDARAALDQLAQVLRGQGAGQWRVMVVGHTDDRPPRGSEAGQRYADNRHLSAARALAVADYLQQAGLPEDRVGVAGFGRHQTIAANDTAAERQANRRVEIFVLGPETPVVGWTETTATLY